MAVWLTVFATRCCGATVQIDERGCASCCQCLCRVPEHDLPRVKKARKERKG